MKLQEWFDKNQPGDEMLWKGSFLYQQTAMINMVDVLEPLLKAPAEVVSTHRSKSIELPVLHLQLRGMEVFLRDNFYDLNICFLCDEAPQLKPSSLYVAQDWDWYTHEIERKRGYSFKGWTDEQMDDETTFEVTVRHENGNSYQSKVGKDEKDRWRKRMTDTSWYGQDWSSGEIIVEGEMGPGCKMYRTDYAYMQGISAVVPPGAGRPWMPGRTQFTIVTNWDNAFAIIDVVARGINASAPATAFTGGRVIEDPT